MARKGTKIPRSPASRSVKQSRAEEAEQQKITAYRSQLSAGDTLQLEKEAFEQTGSVFLAGYRRASACGNQQRCEQYREIIIQNHVRKVVGLSS